MATYAAVTDVSAELGGVSITSATTITSTVVDGWISDAEKEVELMSGQVFATTAVSTSAYEYHDYDGSGVVKLNNWPVVSIESLQYEENGLGAESASWVDLVGPGTESSTNYQLYGGVGAIRFHANSTGNNPRIGHQNIRVAYTYGNNSVPRHIKELVVKIAAKRYVQAVSNSTSSSGGGEISVGAISISDPNNYVLMHLKRLDDDIMRLMNDIVGKFRVYNYDSRLYG